jgi:positive regulator of sigma E activity
MEVIAFSTRLKLMPSIKNGNSHLVMLSVLMYMLPLVMVNLVKLNLELLFIRENLMSNTT